jgi:hypothetical protein
MPGPIDPQQMMELMRYLTSAGGPVRGADPTDLRRVQEFTRPGWAAQDAGDTIQRMSGNLGSAAGLPFPRASVPNTGVSPGIGDRLPTDMGGEMETMMTDPANRIKSAMGINPMGMRLSGDSNLGLALVSAVLPIMAAQGDQSAAFLMELMRGGQGQGSTTGPVGQV